MALDERSALLSLSRKQREPWLGTVLLARLVTFASSFSEGWEIANFSLILIPITKEFSLTTRDVVLLTSAPMMAGLMGYLALGWCMDMLGRKPTILMTYILCIVGSLTMAAAPSATTFGLGRGVQALGIRAGTTCVSLYMAELSPAEHRGALVAVEELYINTGILLATFAAWMLMGVWEVSWRVFVALGAGAPVTALLAILVLRIPESPRFLQMWGRHSEAVVVLRSALDSNNEEIAQTLQRWKESETSLSVKTWWDHLSEMRTLPNHRGFCIATCCWIARAGSGISVVGTYFAVLMRGLSNETTLRLFTIGMLVKTLALVPPVFWLIDMYGRRVLFIASAITCGLSMAAAGMLEFYGFGDYLVACCVLIFFAGFSIGYGPVVWAYCFEILPSVQRGRAASVSMLIGDVFSGILLVPAPYMIEAESTVLYAFIAASNAAAACFFYGSCPETSGLLLEDTSGVERKSIAP